MSKKNKSKSDQEALDRLHEAMNEWTPESEAAAETPAASPLADSAGSPSSSGRVTLIADPFGITPDWSSEADLDAEMEAELSAEESSPSDEEDRLEAGVEEQDPAKVEEDFDRLSKAMATEQAEQIITLTEASGESAIDAKERLAREIAEDQALALAEEAEAAAALEADPELKAALPGVPTVGDDGELDLRELQSCVETLLFMSDKPVSAKKLQEMLGEQIPFPAIQESLTQLKDRYAKPEHGIELAEVGHGYQLRTKPIRAPLAKKLARVLTQRLSTGAMETLAIVAYKQPVMKEEIDQIRGVDSSHFIRTLLDRKLARIAGRSELPGRPMLYATSDDFLEVFGLKDLEAMPPLRELEQMIPSSQSGNPDDEDPRVKQMRKLVQEMKTNSQSILDYDPKDDEKFLQEMREKVNAIPTSTATLDAQRDAEKAAKTARAQNAVAAEPVANEAGQYGLPEKPVY